MKREFVEYLTSIGITDALHERIETALAFYQDTYDIDIADILVTDYIQKDGARMYEHLCYFSLGYLMDAKNFLKEDNFSIAPIAERLLHLTIENTNYDVKKATEQSRVVLQCTCPSVVIVLRAAQENCDNLRDIFLKYFVPNLQK